MVRLFCGVSLASCVSIESSGAVFWCAKERLNALSILDWMFCKNERSCADNEHAAKSTKQSVKMNLAFFIV